MSGSSTNPKASNSSGYSTGASNSVPANSIQSASASDIDQLLQNIDEFVESVQQNSLASNGAANTNAASNNVVASEQYDRGEFQLLINKVNQHDESIAQHTEDIKKLTVACSLLSKANETIKKLRESENRLSEESQRQIEELLRCKAQVEEIMLSTNKSHSEILKFVNEKLKNSTGPVIAAVRELLEATLNCGKKENEIRLKYDALNEATSMNQMTDQSLLKSEYLDFKAKYIKLNRNYMAGLKTYLDKNDDTKMHELLYRYHDKLVKFDEKAEKLLQEGLLQSSPAEISNHLQTIQELNQRIAQLEQEKSEMQVELDACKSQLVQQASEQQQRERVLSDSAKYKDYMISILKSNIKDKETIIADRVADIKRLEEKCEMLERRTRELEEGKIGSDQDIETLTRENRTLNERCEEQGRHISRLTNLVRLSTEADRIYDDLSSFERSSVVVNDEPSLAIAHSIDQIIIS